MCSIALWNAPTGSLTLTGPLGLPSDLRILNTLQQEGILTISGSRTLSLSFDEAVFTTSSQTLLDTNATLLLTSGEAKLGGRLAALDGGKSGGEGGAVVLGALASQADLLAIAGSIPPRSERPC